jgi:DNA-binding beta-propeller fold protein YncE
MSALKKPAIAAVSLVALACVAVVSLQAQGAAPAASAAASAPIGPVATVPGMPPVTDARNLYSDTNGSDKIAAALKGDLERVYVPNLRGNDVWVYDPATLKLVDKFKVGTAPQHIVPSWDMRTLWVNNNAERLNTGSVTAIDPRTGKPAAKPLLVDDPYNMYFTPDGKSAIVVAEARHRLDFRDPQTMVLQYAIDVPKCAGINHADFSIDGRYALFTCEFEGSIAKIDLVDKKVLGYLKLKMPATRFKDIPGLSAEAASEICTVTKGMPQDIRVSPDGKRFYVADMAADGIHIVDGDSFTEVGFITTGVAAHGLYPSRDGKSLYIANRGSHSVHGGKKGPGSVTVIDFASEKITAKWPIPGGGSPDMGNVSADGKWLWLSGRFDDQIYRISTETGKVDKIATGAEPHGLTVWPQPGRYSLGHTGNFR